jgi:hypothetical protein
MNSYNPMLDAIPLSLAHVAGGGVANGAETVDLGNRNDLGPFMGQKIGNKVFSTGKGVLQPYADQALAPTHKIRNRGKQTFAKLKTTPMDRQQETKYERRLREKNMEQINTSPPNGRTSMDVSGAIVPISPTAPGRPQYPVSDHPEDGSQARSGEAVSPIQRSPAHESEDGIPLTRLSTGGSEAQEREIDIEAEAQMPESENDDSEQRYFALPGGPGVINTDELDGEGNEPDAFFHPATKDRQPILWLPKDDLGLCEYEIEMNRQAGVESSCRRAILNNKGKVRIFGPPPVHHTTAHVVREE